MEMIRSYKAISLVCCWLAATVPTLVQPVEASERIRLAITIDDLPWSGSVPSGDTEARAVNRIAAVLNAHNAPATGFVVCDRAVENPQAMAVWLDWGLTLGNHSAAHRDLNRTDTREWLDDVLRCDRFLAKYDTYERPFRFPMLHQGDTPEKREAVAAALADAGLLTAHVTVDTSDWILAQSHAAAVDGSDDALRAAIGREFIRHIRDAVRHAEDVARRKVGRSVSHVLLLHANTLVDDYLDPLLVALRADGAEFITLREALRDPIFQLDDGYIGPKGLSWLYRMMPASPEDADWDDAEARAIRERVSGFRVPKAERAPPSAPPWFGAIAASARVSERMRSLLVMHRGKLVAEAYFNGSGPDVPTNLKSITKSLVSALVGVGLQQGWLGSIDEPVSEYLSVAYDVDSRITIRSLLTMSSGLAPADYGAVQQSRDWVAFMLAQPTRDEGHGQFVYDTSVLQLLTATLENASGRTIAELSRDFLASIEAEPVYWRVDPTGLALGGNDAYLLPRDLIKLGELYRRDGRFRGRQVIERRYAASSISRQIQPAEPTVNHGTFRVRGYGYLWWLLEIGGGPAYAALGHGGQTLVVLPNRELVILMTSRWPGPSSPEHYRHMKRILEEMILPRFPVKSAPDVSAGHPGVRRTGPEPLMRAYKGACQEFCL